MKCLLSIDRCLIVQIGNVLFCYVYLPPVGSVRHIEIISGVLNTISNVIQVCVCVSMQLSVVTLILTLIDHTAADGLTALQSFIGLAWSC